MIKIDILKRPIILEAFYDRAAVIGTNWDCRFSINLLAAVVDLGQFILGLIHKLRHIMWGFKRRLYLNLIGRRALIIIKSVEYYNKKDDDGLHLYKKLSSFEEKRSFEQR